MTVRRRDNHSTQFGLWLRDQADIDSKLGFVASNLDYIWSNYKTGEWMLIEEKRRAADVTYSQRQLFLRLHRACKGDPLYRGLHLLQFERTSPIDGRTWWDGQEVTVDELIALLSFRYTVRTRRKPL